VLGLLWQIIKKCLLQTVSSSTDELIQRLQSHEMNEGRFVPTVIKTNSFVFILLGRHESRTSHHGLDELSFEESESR
jgi:hypothetical protein